MTESGTEIAVRQSKAPVPLYNGVLSPDRWTLFGRIAQTVANTDFVPKGLRGNPAAVMACLLYGDSLDLHPSVSLTDVYVVDGKPGISGALMVAKIREAGHKIKWEKLLDDKGDFVGFTCRGQRIEMGEVVDEDEWTYTLADARRAGLYPNSNPKAAWMKNPEVMCRWRSLAQLARFLFPDLFRGGSVYLPDEAEEAADADRRLRNAGAEGGDSDDGGPVEYGDDPLLAAWLIALFAAANDLEPGIWLPKKQKLALKDKTQDEREELALAVAGWIEERGGDVPDRPQPDDTSEPLDVDDPAAAVVEAIEGEGGIAVD